MNESWTMLSQVKASLTMLQRPNALKNVARSSSNEMVDDRNKTRIDKRYMGGKELGKRKENVLGISIIIRSSKNQRPGCGLAERQGDRPHALH